MHFKDIESRLFIYHKANNKAFYRSLFAAGVLLLPVVFLFIPLPGYWALSLSVFDIRFFLSMVFFSLIIIGLLRFHSAVIQRRYFNWGVDTFGYRQFRFLYCVSRIQFCAPVFILLLAGFVEANITLNTVVRLIAVVALLFVFIVFLSLRQFNSSNSEGLWFNVPLHAKIFLKVFQKIYLRLIILVGICLLNTLLIYGSQNMIFDTGALLFGFMLNIPLLMSCTRFFLKNLSTYEMFFLSLSKRYYDIQQLIYMSCIVTLWFVGLIPMFFFVG
jgi:hypothetical protein